MTIERHPLRVPSQITTPTAKSLNLSGANTIRGEKRLLVGGSESPAKRSRENFKFKKLLSYWVGKDEDSTEEAKNISTCLKNATRPASNTESTTRTRDNWPEI